MNGFTRRALLTGTLLMPGGSASAETAGTPDDSFHPLWLAFAEPMNDYVTARNHGQIRYDKLKEAVKAWRKLSRMLGWEGI